MLKVVNEVGKKVEFGTLEVGEIFVDPDFEYAYIVLPESCETADLKRGYAPEIAKFNALNLENGFETKFFFPDSLVMIPDETILTVK